MDTMAALALATEEPTPELLDRKPYFSFYSFLLFFLIAVASFVVIFLEFQSLSLLSLFV